MTHSTILCSCSSPEHQLIIAKDEEFVAIQIHLTKRTLWRRLVYAVKYILGRQSRYGLKPQRRNAVAAFDEILLDATHAQQTKDLADHLSTLPKY